MNIMGRKRKFSVDNPFTKHPHSVGETWYQHFKFSVKIGIRLLVSSLYFLLHATFPFLFENDAGDEIEKINKELQDRRKNE